MQGRALILLSLLFLLTSLHAQIDTRKLDSLSRSIDSTARSTRASIDSMGRTLDSMMRTDTRKMTLPPPEEKEAKGNKTKWMLVTIAGVAVLGGILFTLYARDRKAS